MKIKPGLIYIVAFLVYLSSPFLLYGAEGDGDTGKYVAGSNPEAQLSFYIDSFSCPEEVVNPGEILLARIQSSALLSLGEQYLKEGRKRKALRCYILSGKGKLPLPDRPFLEKVNTRIAVTLAGLKQYSLAMKYYRKSLFYRQGKNMPAASRRQFEAGSALAAKQQVTADSLLEAEAREDGWPEEQNPACSKRQAKMTANQIIRSFRDGKEATDYAIILHVQQPEKGHRKAFAGLNVVGHTFITLIKYNVDGSSVSNTFGYYPDKDHFLSATPLSPVTSSAIKNDHQHDWDEAVAKFIDRPSFFKILRLVRKYSRKQYNLNRNNCTDFGLAVSDLAGFHIDDTRGGWPLGSGNNPGFAGQSILDGKVSDQAGDELLILTEIF